MKRILLAAAMGLLVARAFGQTLPSPQFAEPPLSDSSNRAATTNWVRGQGYSTTGGGGNVGTTPFTVPGASVARDLQQREATTFNVLDYGAVADGTTDLAPALNAIAAQMPSASSNVILIPAGNYALKSAVTFNGVAPVIEGQGFTAGPGGTAASGTWITVSGTGYTPILFENTNARGAQLKDLAFAEVQPTPAAGWTPTAYDYLVRIQNALGQVTVDNVLMSGVTKGIYADNSGRLDIKKLDGQFYQSAVEIDDCLDIGHIGQLHAWPYATSNANVIAYQEANENTLILHRVDGIFVDDLFSLGAHAAVYITGNATGNNPGTLTKGYFSNVYADFVTYGVWIDSSSGVNAQFANVTTQNNDQTAPGTTLTGGRGLYVTGNAVGLQIGHWRSNITAGAAIDLEGSGANLHIGSLWANTYGTPGAGTPAITNVNTGTNPGNTVQVDHSWLQGVSPLYLFAGSNGGQEQPVLMNAAGNDANSPRAYSVQAGASPSVAAIGSDVNIDLALNGKGTSGVRLQSSGQTVVRADGVNGSTDDVLFRGGSGAMNAIAEGGDANIDIDLASKGGTGGVRLQANGSTSLRADNPNAVTDDLLVRPGSGTIGLTAEGSDANINIILSPQGTGTVVVPTVATTDNATNAASTAWVKAWATALPAISGGTIDGTTLGGTTALPSVTSKTVSLTTNRSWSGTTLLPALTGTMSMVGSSSALNPWYAGFVWNDAMNYTNTTGAVAGLVSHIAESNGAGGPRVAVSGRIDYNQASTNSTAGDLNVGVYGYVTGVANAGGTGGTATGPAGGAFHNSLVLALTGGDSQVQAKTGATWLAAVTGHEFDVSVETGASAGNKVGLNIVQPYDDAQTGLDADAAIYIANQPGASAGWLCGLCFGSTWAQWPMNAGGTLIEAQPNVYAGSKVPMQAANGIDLSPVAFSGYAMHLPNMTVDPLGNLVAGPVSLTQTSAGASLDIASQVVTAAAVSAAGANYPPSTTVLLRGPTGGLYLASTDASGAGGTTGKVTAVTSIVTPGTSTSPPANPIATTSNSTGNGATLNLTWSGTARNTLALNPTGGAVTVGDTTDAGLQVIGSAPGSGFAKSGTYILEAVTSGTGATRLTTNGAAAGSGNCVNPPANTALDVFLELVGIDTTTPGNVARYRLLDGLLYRGATAAATQVVNGASGAAPNGSIGAGSGASVTTAADTTNGCLAVSVTAPNSDTWHWAARVRTTEVQ